ncbi:unnamed protein product [Adineta steineri]|uniref:DFDF domain-containing protein n=1 Tax=Adineta steineri TaxID=433720 RepID=A0A813XPM7_9BILA|nr:unnamed protein product [Adineta steineri]
MSRDFIGSKIAIITKSQCRYVGTIIGIDSQTSSIVLGNVRCFGIENRSGHLTNGHKPGTILPIMQFANSDIEDLKIVDEEQQTPGTPQQPSFSMPVASSPSSQQASIHDDPAIVSAVMSSSNKVDTSNSSISNRLIHNLQHMTLSDEQSKSLSKHEESRHRSNSGELGASWSLLSPSKWEHNNNNNNTNNFKTSSQQHSDNKSKFFDDFISNNTNNTNQYQSNRSHQRSSHNTNSTQTSRENGNHYNGGQYEDNALPVRQPFFSNDRTYPQKQQQQQQHQQLQPDRYRNGHNQYQNQHQQQYQQRSFYNNRRPPMSHQQRRGGGGGMGNRETFQNNPDDYDDDFDFETSNLKFNKLTSEDEFKHQADVPLQTQDDIDSPTDYPLLYDKKKSFFDNLAITDPSDNTSAPHMYNRSKNTDTFGNDGYQRQNNRYNGNGYRGSNNNNNNNYYRQQRRGNDDFNYRQHNSNNNNGYHYRY